MTYLRELTKKMPVSMSRLRLSSPSRSRRQSVRLTRQKTLPFLSRITQRLVVNQCHTRRRDRTLARSLAPPQPREPKTRQQHRRLPLFQPARSRSPRSYQSTRLKAPLRQWHLQRHPRRMIRNLRRPRSRRALAKNQYQFLWPL